MFTLRVISFFFILGITGQLLPLSPIGKMLRSGLCTKEQPGNATEQSGKEEVKEILYHIPDSPLLSFSPFIKRKAAAIHASEQIPPNQSADVVSPPPDL